METIKTKEFAKQWIEADKPCVYRHGWGWKGAGAHHYAGNITHPRQGFREMGVLEIQSFDELEGDE